MVDFDVPVDHIETKKMKRETSAWTLPETKKAIEHEGDGNTSMQLVRLERFT